MSIGYQDFLDRLREERVSRQWSQQQIGQKIRMTQSHYSKAEKGGRRFTYYELKCLCELDLDIYYIFTRHHCEPECREFFTKCTYEELKCYMGVLCSVIEHLYTIHLLELDRKVYQKIQFIQYILTPCRDNKTIFYLLRRGMNFSQKKMADLLEIDVKKLRNMENGSVLPDSEIVWKLSEKAGVPFSLILTDVNGMVGEVSYLMELLGGDMRRKIFDQLKIYHEVLR